MPVVIVTGCSRPTGFGQLTARALASAGFGVFATMRRAERGADLENWARDKKEQWRQLVMNELGMSDWLAPVGRVKEYAA